MLRTTHLLSIVLATGACRRSEPPAELKSSAGVEVSDHARSDVSPAPSSLPPQCTLAPLPPLPAPERVVAVGDLHGDLDSTRDVLRVSRLIDGSDRWVGGKTILVQVGDVLDRGDDEVEILELLEALDAEASAVGGRVIRLNGNHEIMNVAADLRYVTPGGFADFASATQPDGVRARIEAFKPGGPWAKRLARMPIAIKIADSVFVHGGVMPSYAKQGLEEINMAVRCWLDGQGPMPVAAEDPDGPLWSRHFSSAPEACEALQTSLALLGAKRMVVAHTPHMEGITSACDTNVWRIDVGIADFYGGPSQALEIRGDEIRVLAAD